MSEKLTDALLGRLAKIEGGWDVEKCDEPAVYALVWGNDGDEVARVLDNLAIPESAQERAILIALAPELAREVIALRAKRTTLETFCRFAQYDRWPPTKRDVAGARDRARGCVREAKRTWWNAFADAIEALVEEVDDDLR